MADETSKTVYCYDRPNDNSALWAALMGNKDNGSDMAALLNSQNAWTNNPFIYLVLMFLFRNGGLWGNNAGDAATATATDFNSRQIAALQDTVNTNNNNQLAMDAIKGNTAAIGQLANTLNTDYNSIATACCGIKSAIESVSGQVGYSSEKVINAVNLGDSNIVSKLQQCCCENKTLVQSMGYESQLATERQTGILGTKIDDFKASAQLQNANNTAALNARIDQLASGTQTGFASIGYQMQQDKCDIINASNANTQAIKDLLNSHWQQETSLALQDEKFKNSQLQQNQYLAGLINNANGCGCNN